jgi:hypothetical protein
VLVSAHLHALGSAQLEVLAATALSIVAGLTRSTSVTARTTVLIIIRDIGAPRITRLVTSHADTFACQADLSLQALVTTDTAVLLVSIKVKTFAFAQSLATLTDASSVVTETLLAAIATEATVLAIKIGVGALVIAHLLSVGALAHSVNALLALETDVAAGTTVFVVIVDVLEDKGLTLTDSANLAAHSVGPVSADNALSMMANFGVVDVVDDRGSSDLTLLSTDALSAQGTTLVSIDTTGERTAQIKVVAQTFPGHHLISLGILASDTTGTIVANTNTTVTLGLILPGGRGGGRISCLEGVGCSQSSDKT